MKNTNDYIGNPLQIRGAEQYTLNGGKGDGMKFLYVRNGLGLEAWISLDRCADLTRVSLKGENFSFISPCGYVSPKYYDKEGTGFLKSFTAGFCTTCGLTTVGGPCYDGEEFLPMHGTISNTPAELNAVIDNENGLTVIATIRDCTIFGTKLVLKREYYFSYTDNSITMTNSVTNIGETISPFMVLYHCNIGYPVVDEDAEIKIPHSKLTPRNEISKQYIDTALLTEKPQADFVERCYYYDLCEKDGVSSVGIYNNKINKGVVFSFKKDELPCFTLWKMMGKSDYVIGLEPGNSIPDGREVMRNNNTLKYIDVNETKTASIKFSFHEDKENFDKNF